MIPAAAARSATTLARGAANPHMMRNIVARRNMAYVDGPFETLPFQTRKKWRLVAVMSAFLGTATAIPMFAVFFQLYKSNRT